MNERKAKLTLHNEPGDGEANETHLAILISAIAHVFTLAEKVPGASYPIHVSIEMAGKTLCGEVEPVTEGN